MRAAVLSLLLLSACSGYDDLALLEVQRVEPPEVEPGTTIRIQGRGFPLGREPEVELVGTVYRPGVPKEALRATLHGRVLSEEAIEIPADQALFDALGGRATVEGWLRVEFRAADGYRDVFAEEPVRIDFLPDTAVQLRALGVRMESANLDEQTDATQFGIELSREDLGSPGVRVLAVHAGSLAARQGLRPGDEVVGLDGMSIYRWRDFVPDPSSSESTVWVSRDGLRGSHALRWPHEITRRTSAAWSLGVFVLVGLLLGWCSPAVLLIRRSVARVPLHTWSIRAGGITLFSALMLLVPAVQWTTMWIVALGTLAALYALATRERASTISFALAVGATLTVMLTMATASVAEIIAGQQPQVLRWNVFQSPPGLLACLAYLHALGPVGARSRLSASLYVAPAAVLGAVLFLGGWPLASPAVGIAVLAVKAFGLLLCAHVIEIAAGRGALLCGLGLALALSRWVLGFDAAYPEWSALAVGLVCALAARAIVPFWRRLAPPIPA